MFSAFERWVAFRYLRARRQEGFISVTAWFSFLGIALGVAALIIVMSVMNGFRHELIERIIGMNGHLAIYSNTGSLTHFDTLTEDIKKLPGITGANPIVEGQAMAMAHGNTTGVMVHGMYPSDLGMRRSVADHFIAGGISLFERPNAAIIGKRLADKLGLIVGDKITLVAPQGNATAFGTMPRTRTFEVAAIFDAGLYYIKTIIVFMETNMKFLLISTLMLGALCRVDLHASPHKGDSPYLILARGGGHAGGRGLENRAADREGDYGEGAAAAGRTANPESTADVPATAADRTHTLNQDNPSNARNDTQANDYGDWGGEYGGVAGCAAVDANGNCTQWQ